MSILQSGVPKCGNFWLYQIIQHVLKLKGKSTLSYIEQQPIYALAKEWDLNFPDQPRIDVLEVTDLQYSYRISSVFRMPIEDIKGYVKRSPHTWTHSPVCKKSPELFPLFDKVIHIVRDPRDRAVSAAKYYCSDYMLKYFPQEEKDPQRFLEKNFDKLMHEWTWHVFDYLRLSAAYHIHICFYEEFLFRFQQALDRLLQYLQIDLSQEEKEALEKKMHFSALKKENPKHLKKGEWGYWMNVLTAEQIERADIIAGPLIRFLNYPQDKGADMTIAAVPMAGDYEQLKQEIIASQYALY